MVTVMVCFRTLVVMNCQATFSILVDLRDYHIFNSNSSLHLIQLHFAIFLKLFNVVLNMAFIEETQSLLLTGRGIMRMRKKM
jgi:hypothetical protein